MRRRNSFLSAFALLFLACPVWSEPSLVNTTKDITGSSVSQTSFNVATIAGDLLVVVAAVSDADARFTVSSAGLAFSEDVFSVGGGSPYIEDSISIWSAPNVSGGSHMITIRVTGNPNYIRYGALEFENVATSNHVLDTGTGRGFTSSITTSSVNTVQSNTLLFAAVRTDGDETAHGAIFAGSGFSLPWSFGNIEPNQKLMTEYRVADAGTYVSGNVFTMQSGDGGGWVSLFVAYAPGGVVPSSPTALTILPD